MIEFFYSMTAFTWWIIIIIFIIVMILPVFKYLDFAKVDYKHEPSHQPLGFDSQLKFQNEEYFSLARELIQSWQWQIKMKLNISFQSYGYAQINDYILQRFDQKEHKWLTPLLSPELAFDEKVALEKCITQTHYQLIKTNIQQDI